MLGAFLELFWVFLVPGGVLGVIGVFGVLLEVFWGFLGFSGGCLGGHRSFRGSLWGFLGVTGGQDGTKKGIERLEVAKNGISKSVFFQCKNNTFGDLDAAKTILRRRVSDEGFERASYPI